MIAKKIIAPDEQRPKPPRGNGRDADAAMRALVRPLPAGTGRGWRANRQGPARGPRPPAWTHGQHRAAFRQNVEYLLRGDKLPDGSRPYPDDGAGRVAEIEVWNVPGLGGHRGADELRRAADWMADTASLNRGLSSSSVLHYQLAAAPEDRNKIAGISGFWRAVGDEALRALGMEHHQAAIVVHADTEHPHGHLVVNRIDPLTAKAQNPWNDVIRLEKAMRQIEHRFGLRSVQGRHVDAETLGPVPRNRPIPKTRPVGDRLQAEEVARAWRRTLSDKPFTTSHSWDELAARLARDGMHLETSGRGLRLAGSFDGKMMAVKLSKVAGKAGNREYLEQSFGQSFTAWMATQTPPIGSEEVAQRKAEEIARARAEQEARQAAAVRRQEAERQRIQSLRSLLTRPARISDRPSLYPAMALGVPAASRGCDLREALEIATADDLTRLSHLTEQAEAIARRQQETAEGAERADWRDAIAQLQAGRREVEEEARRRGDGQPGPAKAPTPPADAGKAPSVADAEPRTVAPSATDAKNPPLMVDPAKREGAKFAVRQWTDDQVLACLESTKLESGKRVQAGDQVGHLFAKAGVDILENEGIRRGLIEIRTRSPRNQLER